MVLKSRKHVFWEALAMTVIIFLIGLFLGMMVETSNSTKINQLYLKSEINLVDSMAVSRLSTQLTTSCAVLGNETIELADRVYEEAKLLEEFEEAGTLTETMDTLHKKYDLLRTLIWMSHQDTLKRCNNFDIIVYLYAYETDDNAVKAEQNVWSKFLFDLKKEREDLILLPIAADQNLTSLNLLLDEYDIETLPAVIVNNKDVFYNLDYSHRIFPLLD